MLKLLLRVTVLSSLALSGYAVLPRALEAVNVFALRNDPARVLLYRLSDLDNNDYEIAIEAALGDDDPELARSIANLAHDRGIPVDIAVLDKISESEKFSASRMAGEVWQGAVSGEGNSPAAFAAALAADLTVVGDIRDLAREGARYPEQDNLVIAIAGAGVVMTGSVVLTSGSSLPAKIGLSAIKTAKKMKKLSQPLEAELVRLTADAVDGTAAKSMAINLRRLDLSAAAGDAAKLVKPHVVERLTEAGEAVRRVYDKQGYRGTLQTLNAAESSDELRQLHRVSDSLGDRYRGALKFKRGAKLAIEAAELVASFLLWLVSAAAWLIAVAYLLGNALRSGIRLLRKSLPADCA